MNNGAMIVGQRSPEFIIEGIVDGKVEKINSLNFYGKYVLFFFYAQDFSFVCPTEMQALQDSLPEFKKRNVHVASVSVDSIQAHLAWQRLPKEKGGIEGITFMMLSDIKKELSHAYRILNEESGISYRGTFIADRAGIVQYGSVHNMEIGRNIPELIRVIDALQFTEKHGELCPVDWQPGEKTVPLTDKGKNTFYQQRNNKQ